MNQEGYCEFCHLAFALAEKRIRIGKFAFHIPCFTKHVKKVKDEQGVVAAIMVRTAIVARS